MSADDPEIDITADPYYHLTPILDDTLDEGETLTHSEGVKIARARSESAPLWSVIVGDELVTTFRGDSDICRSTIAVGTWIDEMVAWWTADEEPEPPGFGRRGSAFR